MIDDFLIADSVVDWRSLIVDYRSWVSLDARRPSTRLERHECRRAHSEPTRRSTPWKNGLATWLRRPAQPGVPCTRTLARWGGAPWAARQSRFEPVLPRCARVTALTGAPLRTRPAACASSQPLIYPTRTGSGRHAAAANHASGASHAPDGKPRAQGRVRRRSRISTPPRRRARRGPRTCACCNQNLEPRFPAPSRVRRAACLPLPITNADKTIEPTSMAGDQPDPLLDYQGPCVSIVPDESSTTIQQSPTTQRSLIANR